MPVLHNGEPFPEIAIETVGGDRLQLPQYLKGSFGVILIYRGSWCPYCNAQLSAFSRATDTFAELGVKVVALSVDDEAAASAFVTKHRLRFPVGFGADADAIAAATGAFTNDEPKYLQSTNFVLDPQGRVAVAVYSSNAIGRLVPDDVAGYIRYVKSQQ